FHMLGRLMFVGPGGYHFFHFSGIGFILYGLVACCLQVGACFFTEVGWQFKMESRSGCLHLVAIACRIVCHGVFRLFTFGSQGMADDAIAVGRVIAQLWLGRRRAEQVGLLCT